MELQNQIYLVIAGFGGATVLLLVLIVVLAVYVKKTRTLLTEMGQSTDGHYPSEMDDGDRRNRRRNENAHHLPGGYPMDVFGHQGIGPRGHDMTKARNDYMHNSRNINGNRHAAPYRNDVEAMPYMGGKRGVGGGGGGGVEKQMKGNSHGGPRSQGSVQDSALELEVANIFDMDELDEEDLSDCASGASGREGGRPEGPTGHGRSKRPGGNAHQYEREMGRNGGNDGGRGNRFQNPHAAMKSKNGGGGGGGGGKPNQGYFDDRGSMY